MKTEQGEVLRADEVLAALRPLFPLLWSAFEVGTQRVRDYDPRHCGPADPWLASHIIRYEAKQYLIESGFRVTEIEDGEGGDSRLVDLALSGLQIEFGGYAVKIRKRARRGGDGGLPIPGDSGVTRAFYQQQYVFPFVRSGERIDPICVVLLWETAHLWALLPFTLVLPRHGSATEAQAYWVEPVPPEFMFEEAAAPGESETEAGDDLPEIERRASKVGGGDANDEASNDDD